MKVLYEIALLIVIVGIGIWGFSVAKADIFGNGMVAWYTLDSNDISGTTVTDNSGNGNTGTTFNSPISLTGKLGQALTFNGSSQYISLATITSNVGSGDFSVSEWLKLTGTGTYVCFGTHQTVGNAWWLGFSAGAPSFAYNSTTVSSPTNFNDGKWHLVTGTLSGTSMTLYVDGKASKTGTAGGTVTSSGNYAIGRFGTAGTFWCPGSIDDARLYSRALSANEVASLYSAGLAKHHGAY